MDATEVERHAGAFCARLVPDDSEWLARLTQATFDNSRETSTLFESRIVAVACAVATLALALLKVPVYLAKSILDFGIAILTLNATKQLQQAGKDLLSSGECLLLAAATVFIFAAGIITPQWAFSYYEPKELVVKEDEDTKTVSAQRAELETKKKELARVVELYEQAVKKEKKAHSILETLKRNHQIESATLRSQVKSAEEATDVAKTTLLAETQKAKSTESELESAKERLRELERMCMTQAQSITRLEVYKSRSVAIEQEMIELRKQLDSALARAQLAEAQVQSTSAPAGGEVEAARKAAQRLVNAEVEKTAAAEKKLAALAEEKAEVDQKVRTLEGEMVELTASNLRLQQQLNMLAQSLSAEKEARGEELKAHQEGVKQLEAKLVEQENRFSETLRHVRKEAARELTEVQDERISANGLQIINFEFNGVFYEIVTKRDNPNSARQFERIDQMIAKYEKDQQDVATTLLGQLGIEGECVSGKRIYIDLSDVTDPEFVPDVSQVGSGSPRGLLETDEYAITRATKSYWKQEYDPSKPQKYNATMQEMRAMCAPLFGSGWDDFLQGVDLEENKLAKLIVEIHHLIMLDSFEGLHTNPRERYQIFSDRLNKACAILQTLKERKRGDLASKVEAIINPIVVARWQKVSLDGYLGGLVDYFREAHRAHIKTMPTPPVLDQEPGKEYDASSFDQGHFAKRLCFINSNEIKGAPSHVGKPTFDLWKQMASGEFGGEDFTGKMNTPGIRSIDTWTDGSDQEQFITYMRHGCPTAGSFLGGALKAIRLTAATDEAVVPNYKQFLFALEKARKGAFITTHQQRDGGTEHSRVEAVRLLEENHPNVAVLVQPIGQGNLGKKEGPYKEASTFEQMKGAILENFFERDDGDFTRCKLPKFTEEIGGYDKTTGEIIDFVREVFFSDVVEYTKDEWQEFLLVFYTFQRFDLMFRFQELRGFPIEYITTFCKDFLDRGGIVALTQATISAMLTDRFFDHDWMEEQIRHTLGPPPLVKRIPMIEKKLAIYQSLYPRLRKVAKTNAKLKLLKGYKFAGKWQLSHHRVEGRPEQSVIEKMEDISTLDSMRARCLWLQGAGQSVPTTIDSGKLFTHLPAGGKEGELKEEEVSSASLSLKTPITVDNRSTTLGPFLEQLGDAAKAQNILRCLRLAENGVSGPGKEEMVARIERKEHQLVLGEEEELSIIFTSVPGKEGVYKIEMRKELDYHFTGSLSTQDPRFKEGGMEPNKKFARILTSLTVEFNTTNGHFTQNGSFGWWVKTVH